MKKDRNYLINMYNATSTDDGHGDLETYEAWLERQLISRIEKLDKMEKVMLEAYKKGKVSAEKTLLTITNLAFGRMALKFAHTLKTKESNKKAFVEMAKELKKKRKFKYHGNIKCDCGHKQKDHHQGEGFCDQCACTWFHPNVNYINRKKKGTTNGNRK